MRKGEGRDIGRRKAPSLVDLCISVAICNVKYLGDVGETDLHLLDCILPHCTSDQLMHVEKSTLVRCCKISYFGLPFFLLKKIIYFLFYFV